ncbi:MAG: alkaline phosphatase family protein [Methylococcaceae bacterium]|jgi:hypothetical protein
MKCKRFASPIKPNVFVTVALFSLTAGFSLAPIAKEKAPEIRRAAIPEHAIEHILVIDLENEDFNSTFGANSPAVYLNANLLKQGQLVINYFATSHVSAGNYIAQISGQGTTPALNNDCLDLATLSHPPLLGSFTNVVPGNDASEQSRFPGQVEGDGCVFPAPSQTSHGARTIGEQLDALYNTAKHKRETYDRTNRYTWRAYMEDMGDDITRDYGTADALGGASCAHPPIGGIDFSNSATVNDQYATRHNPFMYFHSVIDNQARCNSHVVPLGKLTVGRNGQADGFTGHLFNDLRRIKTTPKFMFVTPNLCNDGHDATCVAANVEATKDANGKNQGGLVAADLWLKHWMPMILASPAYQSGKMLVVLTFDESGLRDSRACNQANQADCHSPVGPNVSNPGFSPVLALFGLQTTPTEPYTYAGGGQVGAVLLNKRYIKPGTVNTTGNYNHYSALRSYEDILGLTQGGDDGAGHLGYAAMPNLAPFGTDVFSQQKTNSQHQGDDEFQNDD